MSSSHDDPARAPGAESYCPSCDASYDETVETCPKDGSRLIRLREKADPMIGRVLDDRFEVRARLGRGGMGTVYRAWQRSVDREVAIKVIDPRLAHDRNAAKRFLREARLASRLSEPNIVNIYDFGQTEDEILYLAMELLRGRTLAQRMGSGERLEVRRIVAIAVQLCDALEAAHRQGIIHRDLKPQNIVVLDGAGRDLVKVLDFGLAKSLVAEHTAITQSDALLGTPLYMAPEVIGGKPATLASDLYSLGCIVHELLAGKAPFHAPTANAVLAKHLTEEPPPLPAGVPDELADLVGELLRKDPATRPASAADVRSRLLAVPDRDAVTAARAPASAKIALAETIASTPTLGRRSRRYFVAVLAILVLAAGALVAFLATRDLPAAAPPDAAPSPRAIVLDAPPPPPDAAPDAPPEADAAPPDAAPSKPSKKKPRPKPDAGPTSSDPDVDFIPVPR